jgi:hypothetical protein
MLDSLKNKVIDTLQHYPISKGLLPSSIVAAPTFMDNLEVGLKIILLIISIIGASLTAYAKWIEVKKRNES